MSRRSLYGRSRVYSPLSPRAAPRTLGLRPAPACLAESFDGASWPIGSDLTWDEGHGSVQTVTFTGTDDDGSDALKRTLHVVGDSLTIAAPDDSQLTGGHQWFRTFGLARATTELDGPDMQVTATIGGTSLSTFGQAEWLLQVRTAPHVDESLPDLVMLGWLFYFNPPDYAFFDLLYDEGFGLVGGFQNDTSTLNPGFTWTPSEGDEIRVTATGTGDDTVIVAEAPIGNVALTLNQANDWGLLTPGDPASSDFPVGTQAGAGLFVQSIGSSGNDLTPWNRGAWDDVATLDDWEACSA